MTSSNGNIFRVTGHLCWNSPVPCEVPAQRPVTRSFDVFFDLRLNKRLSKQSWGWWFETLLRPLWRHCNESGSQARQLHACSKRGHLIWNCVLALAFMHFCVADMYWQRQRNTRSEMNTAVYREHLVIFLAVLIICAHIHKHHIV